MQACGSVCATCARMRQTRTHPCQLLRQLSYDAVGKPAAHAHGDHDGARLRTEPAPCMYTVLYIDIRHTTCSVNNYLRTEPALVTYGMLC